MPERNNQAASRLVAVTEDKVTFKTKCGRTITLKPVKFLQRFVRHVLPDRFKKIRHADLYASPKALAQARADLPPMPTADKPKPTWKEALLTLTGRDVTKCSACGAGLFTTMLPRASFAPRRPCRPPPRSSP